jgi:hypothetical protein
MVFELTKLAINPNRYRVNVWIDDDFGRIKFTSESWLITCEIKEMKSLLTETSNSFDLRL